MKKRCFQSMHPTVPITEDAALATRAGSTARARVIHVIHSGGFYGAEKVVRDLAREQAAGTGPQPVILALLDPGRATNELADRAAAEGLPVLRLNVDRGFSVRSARAFAAALSAAGASLVHSHGYKATLLHLVSRAARLHRLPLLVTAHGYPKSSGNLKATFYRWIDILSLSFAEAVVAVSGEMRTYLARRNPVLSPVLIPNGIPAGLEARGAHPLLARLASEGVDPKDGVPVIGSAGRLVPMKNHALLIRAWAEVRKRIPCRLVILGEGPLRAELHALWRELVPDEPVRLYDFQPDVLEWMADMDVFCLPSRDGEGLPIALLEAGLLERALVCSDSGGIPEVIRDRANGRLFPREDQGALEAALEDLLRSPQDRAEYGRVLRREILRDHDIGVTHGRYQEAYARILLRA
ncbi:MAG TPA: glycosyltransferase [Fibrobacteria bacterium]|nr:glycosyltransferase [Fibrobacteria bacterium]